MARLMKISLICLMIVLGFNSRVFAGFIYQDFESASASVWSWNSVVRLSQGSEPVYAGNSSLKMESSVFWGGVGIGSQVQPWATDFDLKRNDRITFWMYSLPSDKGNNTVGLKFFDNNAYSANGFEVWTHKTAFYGQWTKLSILFSQLPENFDLSNVNKLEFTQYAPGTYYYDDICIVREDRVYQSFEPAQRSGSSASEYGWKWNDADSVGFSSADEPVQEGLHSWKLVSTQKWGGTGIQSEEKKFNGNDQTFWEVDLLPEKNDRLIFWVYALPENEMDNNLAVQFYDNNLHNTDETKVVVWSKAPAIYGQWTRLEILFSELPDSLDLKKINKIQFQQYWKGAYYFDNIKATSFILEINREKMLSNAVIEWQPLSAAGKYILEQSRLGPEGPWELVYKGDQTKFNIKHIAKVWYRLRWEESLSIENSFPYVSEATQIIEYNPPPIFIKSNALRKGVIKWRKIPRADLYQVEAAADKNGPWAIVYEGKYNRNGILANFGTWYRVRGLNKLGNKISEATIWSKPKCCYIPGKGFIKQDGLILREADGYGDEIVLQGVNLGGYLIAEKWLTGIGAGDNPPIEDDWTIRQVLTERFGQRNALNLLKKFQNAYLNDLDFDLLSQLGINMVRLPIYYRILQNDDGTWLKNKQGQIDFSAIDRVVDACADRGIYVLLDLHGAPGAQSEEFHSGRKDYNRLFEQSNVGEAYRQQTVELWKAIANHYKDNPAVCGYDLLNEPVGAPSNEILWDLYDQIYQAIRDPNQGVGDANHLIVMEGIWDWQTLPDPLLMSWKNIMYQFHYYLWGNDEDIQAHKEYIDLNIAESVNKQLEYNVPVMIGEFTGFNQKQIWDYYIKSFNQQKWSWVTWSYKTHDAPSNWGLVNHAEYNADLPKLRQVQADGSLGDSFEILKDKFLRYATAQYHSQNITLTKLLKTYLVPPLSSPFISELSHSIVRPAKDDFFIKGQNFGAIQNSGTVKFNQDRIVPVISWRDDLIHVYISNGEKRDFGQISVQTDYGNSNEKLLHLIQPGEIKKVFPESAYRGTELTIIGKGFTQTQGSVKFYPAPSAIGSNMVGGDYWSGGGVFRFPGLTPLLDVSVNDGQARIISWTDRKITCIVPDDAISGPVTVSTAYDNMVFNFVVITD